MSGHLHVPASLPLEEGVWVGHRTGLDDVERRKILIEPGLELRSILANFDKVYRY
jgi:hypothetical protein